LSNNRIPGMESVDLSPFNGFVDSVPPEEVPISMATGPSHDWLVVDGRLVRRGGSEIFGDTLAAGIEAAGVLESKWSARARRIIAARLRSSVTANPCPVVLYTNESEHRATLGFRANGAWRTVGKDFSASSYPATGVPTHRVVPMVYHNEYGGLTLHRLNTAEYRTHMCAGSRSLEMVGDQLCWPGYDSLPGRWNGGFGTDPCEVFPTVMVPPLQFPVITEGEDLGRDVEGPWRGGWAFYFSVLFENEDGHLSRYPVPLPPDIAGSEHTGVGYCKIGEVEHCYRSLLWSGIADGPPGTRYKWLMRSSQVNTDLTGGGAVQPSIDDLQFCARIPQGQTSYVDVNGNDFSLYADPRLARINEQQAAPPARYMGAFDGRLTEACLRVHPGALFVAPWRSGMVNAPIDSSSLYGSTAYFVAVDSRQMILRSVSYGVATDVSVTLGIKTLRELQYLPEIALVDGTPVQLTGCTGVNNLIIVPLASAADLLSIGIVTGMKVTGHDIPDNASLVTWTYDSDITGLAWIVIDKNITTNDAHIADMTVTLTPQVTGTVYPPNWAIGIYPGADPEERSENLLRTRVNSLGWFNTGSYEILVERIHAEYITCGMLVYSNKFPSGTVVRSVYSGTDRGCFVTVSEPALEKSVGPSDVESVIFAYDTGDTALAGDPGFVRTFGNAYPAALYWKLSYIDRFRPDRYATTFTAGSPGYAQDALDVWMAGNRRGGRSAFGTIMGTAEVGPAELVFSSEGRMRTANVRTGASHIDEDYTKQVTSWTRGACSPYFICAGNLWVLFACDIGICACDAGEGEHLISQALYNPSRKPGKRGQLEYAIEASVLAAKSDGEDFKIFAQVIGSVLCVQYHSTAGLTHPDREIRYDFSAGSGRVGLGEVLRPDGSPYPWGPPLTIGPSCSCVISDAEGVYRVGAMDTNGGAADGRIDVLDRGTMDNGELVQPKWFTGIRIARTPAQRQVLRARGVTTKSGSGLSVGIGWSPEKGAEMSDWDDVAIPSSGLDNYERFTEDFQKSARLNREAEQYRICDDGSGDCPEVSVISLDTEAQPEIGTKRAAG
jgi:hypothetical protein